MKPQSENQRVKAKLTLLEKLKGLKMKSDQPPPECKDAKNYTLPVPSKIDMPEIGLKRSLFNNNKPEVYLYPQELGNQQQKQRRMGEQIQIDGLQKQKQDRQNDKKQIDKKDQKQANKEQKIVSREEVRRQNRMKRPYYEHYSKEGVYEPCLPHVQEHQNPSGRPTNIPEELTKDVEIVPKRPWVYFGPENVPPTDCEQINANNFSQIFEETKKQKRHNSGILKKANLRNRRGKRAEDQFSQISDDFTSNFNISDSVDLSKDSDLISEFRSHTKKNKSSSFREDDQEDDYSEYSMSGSVTQKQKYNLFDSDQSQEGHQSKNKIKQQSNPSDKPSVFSDSRSINKGYSQLDSDSEDSAPKKRRKKNIYQESRIQPEELNQSQPVCRRKTRNSQKSLVDSDIQQSLPAKKKTQKQSVQRVTRSRLRKNKESQSSEESKLAKLEQDSPSQSEINERKRSLRKRK